MTISASRPLWRKIGKLARSSAIADHVAQFHHAARAGQGVGRDRAWSGSVRPSPGRPCRAPRPAGSAGGPRRGGNSRRSGRRSEGRACRTRPVPARRRSRDRRSRSWRAARRAWVPKLSSTSTMKGTASNACADLRGGRAAGLGVGAVDLGQQGRDHRRAGRRFDDLEAGPCGHVKRSQPLRGGPARWHGWRGRGRPWRSG